jgi:hypothetical protein
LSNGYSIYHYRTRALVQIELCMGENNNRHQAECSRSLLITIKSCTSRDANRRKDIYLCAIKSTLPLFLLNSLDICILALKHRTMGGCLAKYEFTSSLARRRRGRQAQIMYFYFAFKRQRSLRGLEKHFNGASSSSSLTSQRVRAASI